MIKTKRPEIEIGFLIARKVLEQPVGFSRLVEIFEEEIPKEEISEGRTIRAIVGRWLDAFEDLFVISSYCGEYETGKAGRLYKVKDEELLRRLEEEYQKKREDTPEIELSDLFREVLKE